MPSFPALPAELRLLVYDAIIASTTEIVLPGKDPRLPFPAPPGAGPESFCLPTAHDLECYVGFILSCRAINAEFVAHWALPYNDHLATLIVGKTVIKPFTKLADSVHVKLGPVDLADLLCLIDHLPSMEFRLANNPQNTEQYLQLLIWEQRMIYQRYYVKGALCSDYGEDGTLIVGVVWYKLAAKRREKGLTWCGA